MGRRQRWNRLSVVAWLAAAMLITSACTSQHASTVTGDESESVLLPDPLSSAATPGVEPGTQTKDAETILERAKDAIGALDLSESDAGYVSFTTDDPGLVFTCRYSPAEAEDQVPLLACRFGEFVNTVVGHALFWHDGTGWRAQLYPQAQQDLAERRYQLLGSLGENCPIGCGSEFLDLRQEGTELLVVLNLSGVSTHDNHEVHLLERAGGEWRVLWVPDPQALRYSDTPPVSQYPRVSLADQGIDKFRVLYADGSVEIWTRQGTAYVPIAK